MKNFYRKIIVVLLLICSKLALSQAYTENFDDIFTLTGSGWHMQNNSSPVGALSWFQGTATTATPTPGPFNSYNGAANAYIAANFNSTGSSGTISNWLITPNRTLKNGDVFTFYTRKPTIGSGMTDYADRLEVRLSTNGASTNVGIAATEVGDFTTLLLSINPTLVSNVYPQTWKLYTITISGLTAPTSGRLAFRYFVTGAGSLGTNSDYIGIDNVVYTPYVCTTITMTAGGALTGGNTGTAYTTTLTQAGSLGSPDFTITAGALPPGVILYSNGTIAGTPTTTGTFNFTVRVKDASGCSGTQSYSITVACGLNPITMANFPTLCSNDGLYTLVGASPSGGTYSGTGVSGGQFDPSVGTQTITYTYTDFYGCVTSQSKVLTVSPSTATPTGQSVQSFNIDDDLTSLVVNGTNLKWYANLSDANNHTNAIPTNTKIVNNTTYYVTQTIGSCESPTALAILAYNETLSSSNIKFNEFKVYPNPFKDVLNINNAKNIQRIDVLDLSGKLLESIKTPNNYMHFKTLKPGIYVMKVTMVDGSKQTIKIIKE